MVHQPQHDGAPEGGGFAVIRINPIEFPEQIVPEGLIGRGLPGAVSLPGRAASDTHLFALDYVFDSLTQARRPFATIARREHRSPTPQVLSYRQDVAIVRRCSRQDRLLPNIMCPCIPDTKKPRLDGGVCQIQS